MATQLKSAVPTPAGTTSPEVTATVSGIIADIRDAGRRRGARVLGAASTTGRRRSFRLDADADRPRSSPTLPQQVIDDIVFVQAQVRRFAQAQRDSLTDFEIETAARRAPRPEARPGRAPPAPTSPAASYPLTASAHMTIVTAKVAGVPRVVACTPPIRGEIPAATVAAMHLAGADEIYLLGGVQAVAAMALGTETIDRVNLIAGPGNAYVAEAKRQLFGEVGIDLFAGPTEILVIADDDADPFVVAVDLLSPGRARPGLAGRPGHHQRRVLGEQVDGAHRASSCPACRPATTPSRPGATTAR